MTMRLVQQTQSTNTSEIGLRLMSCTVTEKEYEGVLCMLCKKKEEKGSEIRLWCVAESWLHVLKSDMSSVLWSSAMSTYQDKIVYQVSCVICALWDKCDSETLISLWRHDCEVKICVILLHILLCSFIIDYLINQFIQWFFFFYLQSSLNILSSFAEMILHSQKHFCAVFFSFVVQQDRILNQMLFFSLSH